VWSAYGLASAGSRDERPVPQTPDVPVPEDRPEPEVAGRNGSRRSDRRSPSRDPSGAPKPEPEPFEIRKIRDLDPVHVHAGRREDRRQGPRVSYEERVALTLETIGIFRVVSRKALVAHCFDGHPFAANKALRKLERDGLVRTVRVERGKHGYQVFTLTGKGRDRAAARRRRGAGARAVLSGEQRFWEGLADQRQLRHDHQVFEAVAQDAADVAASGGRVRRVRLESELRGLLAAADDGGRRRGGAVEARRMRAVAAFGVGLRVFDDGVPLPDALVEIEDASGRVVTRSVEVASGSYTHAQVAEKERSGFRVYGFRPDRTKRARSLRIEEFPLSWGGR
jgi:hypothetical protein